MGGPSLPHPTEGGADFGDISLDEVLPSFPWSSSQMLSLSSTHCPRGEHASLLCYRACQVSWRIYSCRRFSLTPCTWAGLLLLVASYTVTSSDRSLPRWRNQSMFSIASLRKSRIGPVHISELTNFVFFACSRRSLSALDPCHSCILLPVRIAPCIRREAYISESIGYAWGRCLLQSCHYLTTFNLFPGLDFFTV